MCSTAARRCANSGPVGRVSGMPLSLMVRLARLIRWAMVASGTRNAAAICAVVSPPTARRVSAIWLGADSAGWQQPNSRASESSRPVPGPASAAGLSSSACGVATATWSSRRRRDCSLRAWSSSRREATVISQPRGLAGCPSAGHCSAAASSASWVASSHRSKCPYRRTSAPRTCGASSRSRSSAARSRLASGRLTARATRAGSATPRPAPGRPTACRPRSARRARGSRSPAGRSWRCTPWSPGRARR